MATIKEYRWAKGDPKVTITMQDIYACIDSATQPTESSRQTAHAIKEYLQKFEAQLQERKEFSDSVKAGLGFFSNSFNGEAYLLGKILAPKINEKEKAVK